MALLATGLLGCGSGDAHRQQTARQDSAITSTVTVPPSAVSLPPTGPVSVVADSSTRSARFEVESGNAIVHLPLRMAELLSDSLPGFAPYSTAAYDSETIKWAARRDSAPTVPSVAIGDFDGDGLPDVALIGISRDSVAAVMILTNSTNTRGPFLFFINRPRPTVASRKSDVILRIADKQLVSKELNLHRDAVEEVAVGRGAVVFYVDGGVLRQLQTGD